MGRRKHYDRDQLIDRALEQFWLGGFTATSTGALLQALGVNRFSLYAEFGSKAGLYEAVLMRYVDAVVPQLLGTLLRPTAGLAEVREVLERPATRAGTPRGLRGCLLCNAAAELGAADPLVDRAFRRYTAVIRGGFEAALLRDRARLSPGIEPTSEAELLTTVLIGMYLQLKGGAEAEGLATAAALLLARLSPPAAG